MSEQKKIWRLLQQVMDLETDIAPEELRDELLSKYEEITETAETNRQVRTVLMNMVRDFLAERGEIVSALEDDDRAVQARFKSLEVALKEAGEELARRDRSMAQVVTELRDAYQAYAEMMKKWFAGLDSLIYKARFDRLKTDDVEYVAAMQGFPWHATTKKARATEDKPRAWYDAYLYFIQDSRTEQDTIRDLCIYGGDIKKYEKDENDPRGWRLEDSGFRVEPVQGSWAVSLRDWRNIAQYIQSRRTLNSTTPGNIAAWDQPWKDAVVSMGARGPSTTPEADGLEYYFRVMDTYLECLSSLSALINKSAEGARSEIEDVQEMSDKWDIFRPGVTIRDLIRWYARQIPDPEKKQAAVEHACELFLRDKIWTIRADLAKILEQVHFPKVLEDVKAGRDGTLPKRLLGNLRKIAGGTSLIQEVLVCGRGIIVEGDPKDPDECTQVRLVHMDAFLDLPLYEVAELTVRTRFMSRRTAYSTWEFLSEPLIPLPGLLPDISLFQMAGALVGIMIAAVGGFQHHLSWIAWIFLGWLIAKLLEQSLE